MATSKGKVAPYQADHRARFLKAALDETRVAEIRERFRQKRADWVEHGGEIDLQVWRDIGYLLNAVSGDK